MFIKKDNQKYRIKYKLENKIKQNKKDKKDKKINNMKNKQNINFIRKSKILFYKKYMYLLKITMLIFLILILKTNIVFASSPKMVSKIYDSFSKIQKYITRVSTPIAGAALGTGLLMRKFSFGDEERVRRSKKLIRDTAVAYALILCLDLILSFIETLAK